MVLGSNHVHRDVQKQEGVQGDGHKTQSQQELTDELLVDEQLKRSSQKLGKQKQVVKTQEYNAITMMDRKTTPKEVVERQRELMTKTPVMQQTSAMDRQVKDSIRRLVDQQFGGGQPTDVKDQVRISKEAYKEKEKDVKKKNDMQQQSATQEKSTVNQKQAETVTQQFAGVIQSKETMERQKAKTSTSDPIKSLKEGVVSKGAERPQETEEPDRQEKLIRRYLEAYADSTVKNDAKKSKELALLKDQLKESGINTKQLQTMEAEVAQVMQKELKKEVKKSFLNYALNFAPEKMDTEVTKSQMIYHQLLDLADQSDAFGMTSLKDVQNEARKELQSFVADEMDQAMMRDRVSGGDKDSLVKSLKTFEFLEKFSNFDSQEFMNKAKEKLFDQGLVAQIRRPERGVIDTDETQRQGGQNKQQQRQQERQQQQNQKEELEDELRILMSQKKIITGTFRQLELAMKLRSSMRKLKNDYGLTLERVEELEAEAEGIAKVRLSDMLRESLEERAALLELDGPAYDLVRKKYRDAKKGLAKLNAAPSDASIQEMQDQINRGFFPIIREEYLKSKMHLDADSTNLRMIKQVKLQREHLERLKLESRIQEPIEPKMFSELGASQSSIAEAA